MKTLTEEELMANYNKFVGIVESVFTGEKKENLLKMVEFFADRLITAPASGKEHFHSTYPGGLLVHLLNVYEMSLELYEIWKVKSNHIDYTLDELTLVALFHDFGKLGDLDEDYYVPQDNDWRRANMGELYKINQHLVNMPVPDRTLYLLQHFNVKVNKNEWINIKVHDGLYDEGNKSYLVVWSDDRKLKSHLPYLIHHADMMATIMEYEQWKFDEKDIPATSKVKTKPKKTLNNVLSNAKIDKTTFDKLFDTGG